MGKEEAGIFRRFLAGGSAAATAVFATYPLDLVQTHLTVQLKKARYRGIWNTLSTITKEEGFFQLYRGLGMSLLVSFVYFPSHIVFQSVAPYTALNMSIWETLKKRISKEKHTSPTISAMCGAISGSIASTITYPLDIIRRHMQLNQNQNIYRSYSDLILKIWEKSGVKGFYRGLMPHFLTVRKIFISDSSFSR